MTQNVRQRLAEISANEADLSQRAERLRLVTSTPKIWPREAIVTNGHRRVRLTKQEAGVLIAMAREPGRLLTNAELRRVIDPTGVLADAAAQCRTIMFRIHRKLRGIGVPAGIEVLYGTGRVLHTRFQIAADGEAFDFRAARP